MGSGHVRTCPRARRSGPNQIAQALPLVGVGDTQRCVAQLSCSYIYKGRVQAELMNSALMKIASRSYSSCDRMCCRELMRKKQSGQRSAYNLAKGRPTILAKGPQSGQRSSAPPSTAKKPQVSATSFSHLFRQIFYNFRPKMFGQHVRPKYPNWSAKLFGQKFRPKVWVEKFSRKISRKISRKHPLKNSAEKFGRKIRPKNSAEIIGRKKSATQHCRKIQPNTSAEKIGRTIRPKNSAHRFGRKIRSLGPRSLGPWSLGPCSLGPWSLGPWALGPNQAILPGSGVQIRCQLQAFS